MFWRVRWFLYWLVFISIYIAGCGVMWGLEKLGIPHTFAMGVGIAVGLLILGTLGFFYFKIKGANAPTYTPPYAIAEPKEEPLDERQQQLMSAMKQAMHSDEEMVVQAYGDPNAPNYKAVKK